MQSWLLFCLTFLLVPLFLNLLRLSIVIFTGPRGRQLIAHEIYQERASRSAVELVLTCIIIALLLLVFIFVFGKLAGIIAV